MAVFFPNAVNQSAQIVPTPYQDRLLRRQTMRLSIFEGSFAIIAIALQSIFYTAYLLKLGASPIQIGVGASTPGLMICLIQLFVPQLTKKARTYKGFLVASVLIQAACFIPFGMMYKFIPDAPVWPTIGCMALSSIASGFCMAAWSDWMGHIVPAKRRGMYFASRNRIVTIIQFAVTAAAAYYLDKSKTAEKLGLEVNTLPVFTLIWLACFGSRTISGILFMFHYEPSGIKQNSQLISIGDFVSRHRSSDFGKFMLGLMIMSFAANVSGPFFVVYQLRDLDFSYKEFTFLSLVPSIATILFNGLIGRICDKFGNVRVTRLCAMIVIFLPMTWVLTQSYWILICNQMLCGIAWGAYGVTTFNYSIQGVSTTERASTIAYMNAANYFCMAAGALTGGVLCEILPKISDYQIHSIFVLSSLIRIIPAALFQTMAHDKKQTDKMNLAERMLFDPNLSYLTGLRRAFVSIFNNKS